MGDRLLVIGGNAAGMAAAALARRRTAALEIVAIEKGRWTSYSACGFPFVAGGSVHDLDDLVVRSPDQFRAARIDVRLEHEVVGIDMSSRKATVHNLAHGRTFQLGFDMLHLAPGGRPAGLPDGDGFDLGHVFGVQTMADATALMAQVRRTPPKKVAVIGSGYVGLELAEAFLIRGAEVTVIDGGPEVMSSLDPDIGSLVSRAMRNMGITVQSGTRAQGINESAVLTTAGEVPADLVILGLGVEPNTGFLEGTGLETGISGSLVVDRQQRTSVEGVWAAGDCCQTFHAVSGRPTYAALGTVANKQGRVAAINMTGGYATFPGVLGTAVTRLCHLEIGRTGLNESEAREAGFEAVSATISSSTTAGYMPETQSVTVKLVGERGTGRLLGAQIAGGTGSAKRVDVVAAALVGGIGVEDLVGLDLGYSPALSPLWDPLQVAARRLGPQI